MTHHPDDWTPEEPGGSDGPQPGPRLDEDAAWADIVAHYGERPSLVEEERSDVDPVVEEERSDVSKPPSDRSDVDPVVEEDRSDVDPVVEEERSDVGPVVEEERSDVSKPPSDPTDVFDHSYLDAQLARQSRDTPELNTAATWDDEGHFVPPTPPPLPRLEPRRKAAWLALFGSPVLMLLGVVLGWTYPGWVSFLLVAAFVGGFGYLVATMPRGGDRGWPGDDGAVV